MKTLPNGITFKSTPSHGYFYISDARYKDMQQNSPALLEKTSCYSGGISFEEDVEWARIVLAFLSEFDDQWIENAKRTIKDYHPYIYMKHTGETLTPADSYVLAQEEFYNTNTDNYITIGAHGSWHDDCPEGYVLVNGIKGLTYKTRHNRTGLPMQDFLVTKDRYDNRDNGLPYVIQPDDQPIDR